MVDPIDLEKNDSLITCSSYNFYSYYYLYSWEILIPLFDQCSQSFLQNCVPGSVSFHNGRYSQDTHWNP